MDPDDVTGRGPARPGEVGPPTTRGDHGRAGPGEPLAQAAIVAPPLIYLVALLTVLVLGLNWPIMTWGLETIPPLWLTSVRLLGAGVGIAAVLALRKGLTPPPRRDYSVVVSVAVIRLALVYGLVTTALLFVPPGRSSLLVHTTALWAAPIGAWYLRERLSRTQVAGLVLGVGGIALLMEPWTLQADATAPIGYGMLLAGAVASAVATVHVRGHRWAATPLMLMPWQLLAAGMLTTILAFAVHGPPRFAWTPRETAVIAYQVVLASGYGLWGTLTLSRSLPAVTTGVLFMAVPAIGIASSVLLVGETFEPILVAGIGLVFVAVCLNVLSGHATPPQPEGTG